jgi:hypothetical protein
MNNLNYASREASQRLVDVGIVLETEKVWFFSTTGWELVDRYTAHPVNRHYLPAPSMAEVWRELRSRGFAPCSDGDNWWLCDDNADEISPEMSSINPSDALIDLLIHIKGLTRTNRYAIKCPSNNGGDL